MFLEIRHLRTLAAVYELESLAAAAERLHLTQSALSHQIKAIETYYKVSLFTRKTRPMQLTPAGKRLLALAQEVLPAVDKVERDMRRQAAGSTGRLHIALECHSCFAWLLPVLESFRQDWPEVEVDLSLSHSFDALDALTRGAVDAVITSDPQPLKGLLFEPLFSYEVVLVLSPEHPLTTREFVTPENLASETLVTYPVERERLDVFSRFLTPAGVEPAGLRSSELTAMIAQLVAVGRGVAALPNWAIADEVARGLVQTRPLGEQGLFSTMHLAMRTSDADLAFQQGFVETARRLVMRHLHGVTAVEPNGRSQKLLAAR